MWRRIKTAVNMPLPVSFAIPFLVSALPVLAQESVPENINLWIGPEVQAVNGDHRFEWGEHHISVYNCSNSVGSRQDWTILSTKETGESLFLTIGAAPNSEPLSFELKKSKETYRGIPVESFTVNYQSGASFASGSGNVTFRRPINPETAISFGALDHCGSGEGFVPGYLNVLFDPSHKEAFAEWVSEGIRKKRLTQGEDGTHYLLSPDYNNAAQVFMELGREAEVMEGLGAQPWVLDYAMIPYPLEGDLHVWLPSRFLPLEGNQTAASETALRRVMKLAFPLLSDHELVMNQTRATSFEVKLSAPMERVSPGDRTFEGYWLVATLRVTYYIERRGNAFNWAGTIEAGDGFLPRRPADAGPPLPSAYLDYQLSEDGNQPYRNSQLLWKIQNRLLQQHVRLFGGQLKGG